MQNIKHHGKHILTAILAILMCMSTGACSKVEKVSPVLPEGYMSAGEAARGGKTIRDANIYSLELSEETESKETFTFTMMSGSAIGATTQSAASGVPKYTVTATDSPQRICITFENITYTDYERADINAAMLYGIFQCKTGESESALSIYLQFRCHIAFSVTEDKNVLTLKVIKSEIQPEYSDYSIFVTANLYSEYSSCATSMRDSGMELTMTKADDEYLLISKPFETETDATEYAESLKSQYPDYAARFSVIAMYDNELPIYDYTLDYTHIFTEKAVRINSAETQLDTLIPNGIYQTDTNNGGFLYAKRVAKGDSNVYELWEMPKSGTISSATKYINFELENIEAVEFSPDNRKLAVLENSSAGSHLYIFDLADKELLCDLADAGFGKRISSFVWSSTGTAIYAISGTTQIRINMYDFNVTDELKRASVVYDEAVDESSLQIINGELFFVNTDENGAVIYSLRPEAGVKKVFANGSAISFSDDGKYVAITTANAITTSNATEQVFKIMNTESCVEKQVCDEFPVYDFFWAENDLLYYIEDTLSGADTGEDQTATVTSDKYPYRLYQFDVASGKSTYVCDMTNSRVAYSKQKHCLVLPYFFANEKDIATYIMP